MSVHEEVEILHKIPIFAGVQKDHLNVLAFATEHLDFAQGDIIVEQGAEPNAAFVIVEGDAEIVSSKGKKQAAIANVEHNSFIGETAILNNMPYRLTVRAKTDVKALKISKDLFYRSLTEFPEMAVAIMRVLSRRLDETLGDMLQLRNQILSELESPQPAEG
jgi:CRP-like cAMP-binding protein